MRHLALALLLAVVSCSKPQALEVRDVWARDTIGGTANAAVFMTITSDSADQLISASSPAAAKTDLMTMGSDGGVTGMAYLKAIDVPAGQPVALTPTGLHVWLADLKAPLKSGQFIPLTLKFEKAGERRVDVVIIPPSAPPPGSEE